MHNFKRKEEGGALQDKAVRRDWFSETQLRDGHKKDESEKKGIKSLGESQAKHPFASKTFVSHIYLFQLSLGVPYRRGEKPEALEPSSVQRTRRKSRYARPCPYQNKIHTTG